LFWVNWIILIFIFFIILVFFVAPFILVYLRLFWWNLFPLWRLGWMSFVFSNFSKEGDSILRAINRNSGTELTFVSSNVFFILVVACSDSCLSDLVCFGRFFMEKVSILTLLLYQLYFLIILVLFFLVWLSHLFFQFFFFELLFFLLLIIICLPLLLCHIMLQVYFLKYFGSIINLMMIHMVLYLPNLRFLALFPCNTFLDAIIKSASHIWHCIWVKSINFKLLFCI